MLCLAFRVASRLFSKMVLLLYITTSYTWVLEFLHFFINTSYSYLFILAILVCVKYILIVLLIFISLMTKTVEYVFICLLSLCISSLEKSLFQFFAYLSFCRGPIGLWPLLWPLITIKNPGFPGGSEGKKSACDAGDQGSFNPWVGKIRWRSKWLPTPVFLPGEFHGQRSLVGYSRWGCKESDTSKKLRFRY